MLDFMSQYWNILLLTTHTKYPYKFKKDVLDSQIHLIVGNTLSYNKYLVKIELMTFYYH